VSRGPHFSQKGKVKAKKISLRGLDVARGPYAAPSYSRLNYTNLEFYFAVIRYNLFEEILVTFSFLISL